MAIRVGFILGKEFDFADASGSVVDVSFLDDLPSEYRTRPSQPRMEWPGMNVDNKDNISVDVAIAWYVKKHYPDIDVDFIFPADINLARLKSNECNFVLGYDILDAMCEGESQLAEVTQAFAQCGNIMPSWEVQKAIYMKSMYMKSAMDIGVEVAPTIFASKEDRSPSKLLEAIAARGWKAFLLKQSYSCGSLGLKKFQVSDVKANPAVLEAYFAEYADCPEYIAQEFIEGFSRNWEVRCFWFNDEFLYAIANRAAFSTAPGERVGIISDDEIPQDILEHAKRIGKQALRALPQLTTSNGQPIGMTCIRTDIGCADSPVEDKDYAHWNDHSRNFFLNEIEYGATTYFARTLKFDCIPMWARLYASKAREIRQAFTSPSIALIKHAEKLEDSLAIVSTVESLEPCSDQDEASLEGLSD
jgi:hypothetical protein